LLSKSIHVYRATGRLVLSRKILLRTLVSRRDKVIDKYRVLHKEELCDLYRSAGVVMVVKCGRLRWVGYVASVDIT